MTILHKLNIILISNNEHETSALEYHLSKHDWDVSKALNAKECHDIINAVNTDAVLMYLDNEEFVNYELVDWLTPIYPVIVIDNIDNIAISSKLTNLGCLVINGDKQNELLQKTITESVKYYRFEKAAA